MFANSSVFKTKISGRALLLASFALFCAHGQAAYEPQVMAKTADEKPAELQNVGIDEKLGQKIDLNLKFKDEYGNEVTLGSYFDGKHPVVISPIYYACPGLCNFHLNGFTDALKLMEPGWAVGEKFTMLEISFDSKETPELAAAKKKTYMKLYGREGAEDHWHFLTADEATVQAFTGSVGFKFRWDENQKEWAHASAAIVIAPDGKISRYLPGIMFDPKDIKLALNEAAEGKIGTLVESLVLYCFKYDPHSSKYTLAAVNLMKMGGALMVLVMVLWLTPVWIRSRREQKKADGR